MMKLQFHVEVDEDAIDWVAEDLNDVLDAAFGLFFNRKHTQRVRLGVMVQQAEEFGKPWPEPEPEIGKGRENAFDYDGTVRIWFESPNQSKLVSEQSNRNKKRKVNNMGSKGVDEFHKCYEFLRNNGWTRIGNDSDDFSSFGKDGAIGVDLNSEKMVFIGDTGDFLHLPVNKFTLIGVLLEYRQLPINYKS